MLQIQVKCLGICIHWVKYTKDSQHLVLLINTGSLNYLTTMHTFLSQKKQEYLTFFPLVNTFLSLNKFKFLKSVFVMDQNCFPSDLWSEKVCQTQLHAQQMRLHNLTILLRKPVQQNTYYISMSGLYCNLGSTLTSNKEALWLLTDTSTISRFILGDPGADTGGDRKSKWAKI